MKWKTDDEDYQVGYAAVPDDPDLQIWWESILDHFEFGERMIFLVFFLFTISFGVIGNLLTIYVAIAR
jgi:hypothetical protein